MNKPILSICIPSFNGEKTIENLLESLISQVLHYEDKIEIIINDDLSTDNTLSVSREYSQKFSFIKVYQNDCNLGMDGNFTKSAKAGNGIYVWLSGQDDIFNDGAIAKFFNIIGKHPEIDFIYFNYKVVDDDLKNEVGYSRLSASNPDLKEEYFFANEKEYFSNINHVPTFLPATIMRRSYWDGSRCEQFFKTRYVQVGVWLDNLKGASTYVVGSTEYILCRNEASSWKYTNPQMNFELLTALVFIYHYVHRNERNPLPKTLINDLTSNYLMTFTWYMFFGDNGKMEYPVIVKTENLKKHIKYIFKKELIKYYFYLLPVLYTPQPLRKFVRFLYQTKYCKWLILSVRKLLVNVFKPTNLSRTWRKYTAPVS